MQIASSFASYHRVFVSTASSLLLLFVSQHGLWSSFALLLAHVIGGPDALLHSSSLSNHSVIAALSLEPCHLQFALLCHWRQTLSGGLSTSFLTSRCSHIGPRGVFPCSSCFKFSRVGLLALANPSLTNMLAVYKPFSSSFHDSLLLCPFPPGCLLHIIEDRAFLMVRSCSLIGFRIT